MNSVYINFVLCLNWNNASSGGLLSWNKDKQARYLIHQLSWLLGIVYVVTFMVDTSTSHSNL